VIAVVVVEVVEEEKTHTQKCKILYVYGWLTNCVRCLCKSGQSRGLMAVAAVVAAVAGW